MVEPNAAQRRIIEEIDGLSCVDAGPGTGKTFAVTRRYATIVDQPGVEPDDVLLVTFTDNAATEMRERAVARSSYGVRELRDAPIGTFHSRCQHILQEHGFAAPAFLGIDDNITRSTQLLEDELVEGALFGRFVDRFSDDHPEYDAFFRALDDPTSLLGLVTRLAAKGVFPTAAGWYRHGERYLDGDFETFCERFEAANQPRNEGRKQSTLRSRLNRYGREKCYRADAPAKASLRGRGAKAVPPGVAERVFDADRTALKQFVHDVYHGYLAFALSRNYLNFSFLQLFAFVVLCEDDRVRESLAYDYVLVDEFQDTSEIQFKLALLLCGTDNLCVVGDWKQSIYAFQYASVGNIAQFDDRLARFVDELNDDRERVALTPDAAAHIELVENYRSTQSLIDFAEHGLLAPATDREAVDEAAVRERIVSLHADADTDDTQIRAVCHEDEPTAVLATLQAIAGNDDYRIEANGEVREPTFGDIAVLTRTRDFGRELLSAADAAGLPMAYEGGIEVFRTDQAKLLLAWLRILEADADRGWAVVLERAGYTLDEIRHLLATGGYPDAMRSFEVELADLDRVGAVAERVFGRYGFDGQTADVVLETVQSVHDATTMTRGDLIRFIERGIDRGATREVHAGEGVDAVTVQTIHAAKGLEYPIVVLANMNRHKFPRTGGGTDGVITYEEPLGLRQRKVFAEDHGHPHVYDDWQWDALRACQPTDYDEERRLLYVAMTRAEHHLVFTAGDQPNAFLDALPVSVEAIEPRLEPISADDAVQTVFAPPALSPDGPIRLAVHDLLDDAVFEETPEGRGTVFGSAVHTFAEDYLRGNDPEPGTDDPDWANVVGFLDGLSGENCAEEPIVLPLEVDGQRVAVTGVVDLVHVLPDRVEVVDFKTDITRVAHAEYETQVSVYAHVLDAWYPDRPVDACVFYTADDEAVPIDPTPIEDLERLVREHPRVVRAIEG